MMPHYPFARITGIAVIFLACSFASAASEGKPVAFHQVPAHVLTDTVPPVKKPVEEKPEPEKKKETENPVTTTPSVIKVVPKARKQIKPVALPSVPLKTNKIIKPVIKRVGSLIP
ncbi:MAG: hypothetical protein E6Q24_02035 [Chitinophagaceae bacterium]|nr:MAG: hypothetical protein E6Q24_02035 [Chitinophagaceae bacterium]